MQRLFILLLVTFNVTVSGQNNNFEIIAQTISQLPLNNVSSTKKLADYFTSTFRNPEDQVKAAFYWTATNINYETNLAQLPSNFADKKQLIALTLKSKKSVCIGFATIFNDICEKMGFRAYLITGYTMQNDKVNSNNSHAWNAVYLEGQWYLFDPTWAAGHFIINNRQTHFSGSKYIKQFSDIYYKIPPGKFIETHMPFDPIWQFSDTLITYEEFDKQRISKKQGGIINHQTLLNQLPNLTDIEALQNSIERIRSLGKGNTIVNENIENQKRNLQIALDNAEEHKLNQMVILLQNGIKSYNEYVELSNEKSNLNTIKREKLEGLLNSAYNSAVKAQNMSKEISTTNQTIQLNLKIRESELTKLFERIKNARKKLENSIKLID